MNAECRMKDKSLSRFTLHVFTSSLFRLLFYLLHSALCILHFPAHVSRLKTLCLLCVLSPVCAFAAFESVGISARPMGMGGAYVALADDTNAVVWNPAGLARLNERQVGLSYLELYGLVNYSFLAWAQPLRDKPNIAFSLSSSSDTDGLYQELVLAASAAQPVWENLSLGINLKYLSSAASIGEIAVGSGRGISVDVGAQYALARGRLMVGLALPNLLSYVAYSREALKHAEAASYSERLTRESRIGVAAQLDLISPKLSDTVAAFELTNGSPVFGLEHQVRNASLRLGWRLTEGVSRGLTVGLGYRLGNFQLDYGFVSGRYDSQTSLFSVTLY